MSAKIEELIAIKKFFKIVNNQYIFDAQNFSLWAKSQHFTLMQINNFKYLMIKSLINESKVKNVRHLCKTFDIPKSTYYDFCMRESKSNIKNKCIERKKRCDAKIYDIYFQVRVKEMLNYTKYTYGAQKISKMLQQDSKRCNISAASVWKIFNLLNIATNPGKYYLKTKYKEIKSTSQIKENLLNDKAIFNEYKPMEIFSTDYCVLKNSIYGHVHILASIDPISQFVSYVTVKPTQSSKDVKIMIKHLPKTAKILHSDNGSEFRSNIADNICKKRNIQQSFSKPGESTDNRWIEYFWGRLQIEYLNHYDYENLGIHRFCAKSLMIMFIFEIMYE